MNGQIFFLLTLMTVSSKINYAFFRNFRVRLSGRETDPHK